MAIARNNAFGVGSPSWNLSFPDGNLTASEILAYLPHWLKSVDVILRLVNHGGRSVTITHFLNMYRDMPTGGYQPNSTTVMMHYAMRRAGKAGWTIGTRGKFKNDREYDEGSVYVGDFRPPRLTHPKSASGKQKVKKEDLARNWAADPVPFKNLALHVKRHPSGDDALDLTRCVEYALKNPEERWFFPDDFTQLVEHIGGPIPVTHSHLDRQLFARYDHLFAAHDPSRTPTKWKSKINSKHQAEDSETETVSNADLNGDSKGDGNSDDETKVEVQTKPTNTANHVPTKHAQITKGITRKAKDCVITATPYQTIGKRTPGQLDGSHEGGGGKRRSRRQVKKAPVYAERDDDSTDIEATDADYTTHCKKRVLSRIPPTPKDEESDFEAKYEPESSDDEPLLIKNEAANDSDFDTPTAASGKRIASRRACQTIKEQSPGVLIEQRYAAAAANQPARKTFMDHSPEVMAAACAYATRTPIFVPSPFLSENRLVIDPLTVYLYAQEGCRNENELWASALSMYRFGGPRRHAPFRELYRLTEPMAWDTSDWAENVRWAKEQYRFFGVKTWTEYDDHLECITRWRIETLWVSEEAVVAGM